MVHHMRHMHVNGGRQQTKQTHFFFRLAGASPLDLGVCEDGAGDGEVGEGDCAGADVDADVDAGDGDAAGAPLL